MGAFNVVKAPVPCPTCSNPSTFSIQFKYGDTWQHHYVLNDRLRWGGNDIGRPGCAVVLVEGSGGPCATCRTTDIDFLILIENDRITHVFAKNALLGRIAEQGYCILRR